MFLRNENDHQGKRSGLIPSAQELKSEIEKLTQTGLSRRDILVTEFCDSADKKKVYRKFSSFIVDGTIIPRHVFFSRDWHIKKDNLYNENLFQEELNYVKINPHEKNLKKIFEMAGIQYGRIDYGVLDGAIQVWEINTNPVILTPRTKTDMPRVAVHRTFSKNLCARWIQLNQKYRSNQIYPIERYRLYKKRFDGSPEAEMMQKKIQKAKERIVKIFPRSLSIRLSISNIVFSFKNKICHYDIRMS